MAIELEILLNQMPVWTVEIDGPVLLGRQAQDSERLFQLLPLGVNGRRLVVADRLATGMSQAQARIEPLADGRVRVENPSSVHPLTLLPEQLRIDPKASRDLTLDAPRLLRLGQSAVYVRLLASKKSAPPTPPKEDAGSLADALDWFDDRLARLARAVSAGNLYQTAAQAAAELLGAGRALVLIGDEGKVTCKGQHPPAEGEPAFDNRAVSRAYQFRKAFASHDGVVVAPVLDAEGKPLGALYADGRADASDGPPGPKAALLRLLARGVANHLARLEPEAEAQRAITRLTQYMSPEQANELLRTGEGDEGQKVEVSVLFCDVRNFTSITARIADVKTMVAWCRAVLGLLLRCVRERQGTLIDYTGDGLFALWGAPVRANDHANQACLAALNILDGLKGLNAEWEPRIRHATRVGIGVNTGEARVGNVGTRDMPKFGAQGAVVNVGSRIEGMTKFFRCDALLHRRTYEALRDPEAPVRRLARVCPVGVEEKDAFDVYQLTPTADAASAEWRDVYQRALSAYEVGHLDPIREAAWDLARWRKSRPDDLTALVLLRRIVDLSLDPGRLPEGHPVWVMQGK